MYRHKFFGDKERDYLEWNDLFSYTKNEQGEILGDDKGKAIIETNGLLFNVLIKEFVTINRISKLDNMLKEVVELKASLIKLEQERKKQIAEETNILKKEIETARKSFNLEIKEKREELNKDFDSAKKELAKQFLLELGKPLSDKNKAVLGVLKSFSNLICVGIESYNEIDKFIENFKVAIPKLDLARNTKYNLLEVCTNRDSGKYWNRDNQDYKKEWSNKTLDTSLRKLINLIETDIDTNKVLLNLEGNKVTIGITKDSKAEQKPTNKKEIIESEEQEEQEENESEESDLYG
jgi:hypothetical protein